jgi:non-ribosomal peptide synthetase component F
VKPAQTGATLCITPQSHLHSDLAQAVLDTRATNVDLTPTVSELLLEASESESSPEEFRKHWPLRHLSTGAETVGARVRDRWLARGVEVVQDYGPRSVLMSSCSGEVLWEADAQRCSETTVGVISTSLIPTPSSIVPIGRPVGSNTVYLLASNPSLDLAPLGAIGEICIGGPQVTRGYLRPSLNEGVFVKSQFGRIYRTGDLGKWIGNPLADGEVALLCLGRKDSQVKINGLR